ncbi:MAG: protein kinase domain-containing protein, partial [Phycisphaerales bacterium]
MADDTRQQARRVFMEVADLPHADQQAALDRECGVNATLRAEVEALLRAELEAGGFMASPTVDVPAADSSSAASTLTAPLREGPGTHIGPYKILQLIGEGGFGSVFMAEQERPVVRRVALKIIKLGMDTRHVVARFEQERQALAMMDHPNIARVLDAGATNTGRPFFVMELVKGEPIVAYCDRNNLSI